jgi:ABC-type nickel/cobalt efflux system permease component RcnA
MGASLLVVGNGLRLLSGTKSAGRSGKPAAASQKHAHDHDEAHGHKHDHDHQHAHKH